MLFHNQNVCISFLRAQETFSLHFSDINRENRTNSDTSGTYFSHSRILGQIILPRDLFSNTLHNSLIPEYRKQHKDFITRLEHLYLYKRDAIWKNS
jgi:hypothetical protein